ncbi:MAG: hypothetical protein IT353_04100 [Gemmatimonadaceae bacterium]|nr:hypothetical protein [Gemmatimonadaceae bacterium]
MSGQAATDSATRRVVTDSTARELAPRALADLLRDASARNVLPADLQSYRADVQSEISVLLRREEGTEAVAAIEQVASTMRWTRAGQYDQHVVGYRGQQSGPNVSMLSVFQTGWLQPALYGNRLSVRTNDQSNRRRPSVAPRSDSARYLTAVHPLAADRDGFYTYAGGDTIVTIRASGRTIPIAHVRVTPRRDLPGPVVLFEGDLDLDASRGTLVRMRGTFLRIGGSKPPLGGALGEAVAFIEYENAERVGKYWLPATQRIELQAGLPALGEQRAVIRIVSRFRNLDVNDTVLSAATLAVADSLRALSRRRLTYATTDSVNGFGAWPLGFGVLSDGLHSDDFLDIAPDRWRAVGAPRIDWTVPRAADLFHFNRVEGAFTGFGSLIALRDVAPGVVVRVNGGWAWREQTARGRVSVERKRGPWVMELRGGRSLDNTNDFRVPFDSGNTFGALFASVDPYDYVDRRSATVAAVRTFGARRALVRAEFGIADDRYSAARYVRSPFGGDAFRPNRGVDEGSYRRSAALIEWNPDVSPEFVKPGVSSRVLYERGDGTLAFQRIEVRVTGRQNFGPFVALARGDAGTLLGDRPPAQQLFELGERQNLPGYADKEFAGTRAAVLRGSLQYLSPFLRQPLRLGRMFLPAIAPGLSVGIQSGWTEAPNAAALAAIDRLAIVDPRALASYAPVSRPSDGIRASVTAGLRLFSGGAFVGATRQVDQAAPWKFLVAFGQQY